MFVVFKLININYNTYLWRKILIIPKKLLKTFFFQSFTFNFLFGLHAKTDKHSIRVASICVFLIRLPVSLEVSLK